MRYTSGSTRRSRLPGRRPGTAIAAALLATGLVATTAACTDSDSGSGDGDQVELRFSWWGNDERAQATEQAIDAFEDANPDIRVIGETSDFDAYFDRIATEVAAGSPPDVITMGGAYPGEYGGRGALLDLDSVSDVLDTSNIEESSLGNGVFDGVQYGIPTGVNTFGLVVNPNLFDEAGVDLPDDDTWSWDDFVALANELADALPEDHYALMDPTAAETLELFSLQRGEGLYTPEGGVAISEQSVADWWEMTTGLRDTGATPSADLTAELEGQPGPEQTLMGRGLAAMQFDWSNQLPALRSASGEPLTLMRVPGESTGQQPAMWLQASQLYTISADSDHPEEAAKLVDFLVNTVEAAEFILTDRGVPSNSEVLEAITPNLDEDQAATADFIARVLPTAGRPLVIGPVGSTETVGILDRYNAEVLFDRMTPAEAAEGATGVNREDSEGGAPSGTGGGGVAQPPGIDRRDLVRRHTIEVTGIEPTSPLSVGNGQFCYTVDITGTQTFPDAYPVADPGDGAPGTLLATQSQWGWHSSPGGAGHRLNETLRTYQTPRGPVPYVDMRGDVSAVGESPASAAESWLRNNPHRLDLARIGLVYVPAAVAPEAGAVRSPAIADLTAARQRIDLYSGLIVSEFRLRGEPVRVSTVCHPDSDQIGLRVESRLLGTGRLGIRLAFPYGSESWSNAADWSRPDAHRSVVRPDRHGCTVARILDDARYTVRVETSPTAEVSSIGEHQLLVRGTDGEGTKPGHALELVIGFAPGELAAATPVRSPGQRPFDLTVGAARRHWARFWGTGAAVDLSGSTDPRAPELERRVVLSQYLTAIHCAGSLPPQETGLMVNSWRGRFHLEMHYWHGAHFPLWDRPELLERSLSWYVGAREVARDTARAQGYAGARWPKQVGPDARESPSPIGPFLLWQQPHPIVLAELVYRATGSPDVLRRYAEVVLDSAEFMADVATCTETGYQLGPPLVPAQESYADLRATLTNPTFELAYWRWGLRIAQRWRTRLGLPPAPAWSEVAERIARPAVHDAGYPAIDVPPYLVRTDHPSMLYALGVVPPVDLIDPELMRATLHGVLPDRDWQSAWDWESTWGWDYPAIAMTATRLGEPETAVRALLLPAAKNTYLRNGHNRQTASLPIYLPGNGGLLTAVALMARGSESQPGRPAPGFPDDGGWQVQQENLHPYL